MIDLFWYMNPEFSVSMFPHPYIRRGMQEAVYARGRAWCGWRDGLPSGSAL